VPGPGDYDVGEIGGMISRENRSTRRKPAQVPLCPPQTPYATISPIFVTNIIIIIKLIGME
jgi:hypothetical protein